MGRDFFDPLAKVSLSKVCKVDAGKFVYGVQTHKF